MDAHPLFRDFNLEDHLQALGERMRGEIEAFKRDYLLQVSLDDLAASIETSYYFEPIVLTVDRAA